MIDKRPTMAKSIEEKSQNGENDKKEKKEKTRVQKSCDLTENFENGDNNSKRAIEIWGGVEEVRLYPYSGKVYLQELL